MCGSWEGGQNGLSLVGMAWRYGDSPFWEAAYDCHTMGIAA